MTRIRALTTGFVVAGVLAGHPVAGAERKTLAVVVVGCDEAGVDWETVARATHITSEVYRKIGVDLAWRGTKLSNTKTAVPAVEETSAVRAISVRLLCESQVPRTTRLENALGFTRSGTPLADV